MAAPPRMRHRAAQVIRSSGRDRLNAVYDVTDSSNDGSGINCEEIEIVAIGLQRILQRSNVLKKKIILIVFLLRILSYDIYMYTHAIRRTQIFVANIIECFS